MLSVYDLTSLDPVAASKSWMKAVELGFDSVLLYPFARTASGGLDCAVRPGEIAGAAAGLRFIANLPAQFLRSRGAPAPSPTEANDNAIDPRAFTRKPTDALILGEIEDAVGSCQQMLSQLVSAGYRGIATETVLVPFIEAALARLGSAHDSTSFVLIVNHTKNILAHDKLVFPHAPPPTSLAGAGSEQAQIALYREHAPFPVLREVHDADQLSRYLTQMVWRAATDSTAWRCPSALITDDAIAQAVEKANTDRQRYQIDLYHRDIQQLSAPDTAIRADILGRHGENPVLRLVNTDLNRRVRVKPTPLLARSDGLELKEGERGDTGQADQIIVEPGEILWRDLRQSPDVRAGETGEIMVDAALAAPRITIANLQPRNGAADGMIKRTVGDEIMVICDLLCDGHDQLGGRLLWRAADTAEWQETPLRFAENDRWIASFSTNRVGLHFYSLEVWRDDLATYQRELAKKAAAGQDIGLEIREGEELLHRAASAPAADTAFLKTLQGWHGRLTRLGGPERLHHIENLPSIGGQLGLRSFVTRHDEDIAIWVDRYSAVFSAWYEIFPRSQAKVAGRHGTFLDVIDQLSAIRAMGFDTLYFPPIHPIGRVNRKGRNNSLRAAADDPGSPYAIGAAEGGHDALHPELGSLTDFQRLRTAAAAQGIELAMDFAIQCAPDHPWLAQHPEWFRWRPDGSIHYAENPPKKYEDIVNVDFYAPGAMPSLWLALRDVVLFWRQQGVRTFRVDNPHTKPFPFWCWLIRDIQAAFPDTVFLSEAFTRPKIMYRLAEIGFTQSYTYFTWRNTKRELEDYLTEITQGAYREVFRPHFFVNTPDINPRFLQESGRPGFLIRAALAATLSGLWGVYNGFETCEARALPGKEEYLDSEKYQLRQWDRSVPGNIVAEITQLNRIRRENPALHSHLGLTFLHADNDQIIYFSKRSRDNDNTVLVAINLDPFHTQSATVEIPLWFWNLPDHDALRVTDLLDGHVFAWRGKLQRISLDPLKNPYAIWRITGGP